MNKLIFLET